LRVEAVERFLTCFEVNDGCLAISAIHLSVENIVFLREAPVTST
jgi:hypothetical protein